MATVEWLIGEELVSFRKDPSTSLLAGNFRNIINDKRYSQQTLRVEKSLRETVIPNLLYFL